MWNSKKPTYIDDDLSSILDELSTLSDLSPAHSHAFSLPVRDAQSSELSNPSAQDPHRKLFYPDLSCGFDSGLSMETSSQVYGANPACGEDALRPQDNSNICSVTAPRVIANLNTSVGTSQRPVFNVCGENAPRPQTDPSISSGYLDSTTGPSFGIQTQLASTSRPPSQIGAPT